MAKRKFYRNQTLYANHDEAVNSITAKIAASDFEDGTLCIATYGESWETATSLFGIIHNQGYTLFDKDELLKIIEDDEEVIAAALNDLNTNKQDLLVSAENIKTVNGQTLLGSGNVEINPGVQDAVRYGEEQDLSDTEKLQARTNISVPTFNIGSESTGGVIPNVRYDEQNLTGEQKNQARENIGAVCLYEPKNIHWTWESDSATLPSDFLLLANSPGAPKPHYHLDSGGEGNWSDVVFFNEDGSKRYVCEVMHSPDFTPDDLEVVFHFSNEMTEELFTATARRESAIDTTLVPVESTKIIYTLIDAPWDGKLYARQGGIWAEVKDAPKDNKAYVRKNGAWVESYTKAEIDAILGDINTQLENI